MRKILSVAAADLRVTFSDRSIWTFMVLVPIVLIVAVSFANGGFAFPEGTDNRVRVDVIDEDNTTFSAALIDNIKAFTDSYFFCPVDNNAEDGCLLGDEPLTLERADARIEARQVQAVIIIPAGYGDALTGASDAARRVVYRSDEPPTEQSPLYVALSAALQRANAQAVTQTFAADIAANELDGDTAFAGTVYSRAQDIWAQDPVRVSFEERVVEIEAAAEDANSSGVGVGFRQSVPGIGSMYVLFTVLAGAVILIEERKNWTMQRLMTMPVTRMQVIAGKTLSRFAMGMMQFAIAFGAGIAIGFFTDVSFGNDIFGLLLVMASFVFFAAALTLLLATIVGTEQQASGITTLLALTLAPIGGAWWSLELEFIPDFMQQIAYISPIKWAMDGFNAIIGGGTWVDTLPFVAVLTAVGLVFFAVASMRFRYE